MSTGCAEGSGTHADRLAAPDNDDSAQGSAGTGSTQAETPLMPGAFTPLSPNLLVTRQGTRLLMGGQEFRFAGANNYYLMYSSPMMVDDVLVTAASAGFNSLRVWGSLDIGGGSAASVSGPSNGVYLQSWDGQKPVQNTGANGLQRLDYVVARAGQLGLKLVIPFVNNWNDFGGMDQYVRWRESSSSPDASGTVRQWYHDDFYTDPTIKQWYKDWISALLNRVNSLTGVVYRQDPTIALWELGNEPRCAAGGAYPRSQVCTTETISAWADEMTTFVKSVDPIHLVSVGDEGFYCLENGMGFTETCGDGIDSRALIALPNVDVMSVHLYPNDWGTTPAWGTDWITRHIEDARAAGKVSLIGEFGLTNKNVRNSAYRDWTRAVEDGNGNGALYWILSGKQDNGALYGDFDGYTIYAGTPTFQLLTNFASALTQGTRDFAPIADNDTGYLTHDTSASFSVLGNDIAYDSSTLTLDLDLQQDGSQSSVTLDGTLFEAQPDGAVRVTPRAGYVGRQQAMYRVSDSQGRSSNSASLSVVVSPDPVLLTSFEAGSEGWAALNPGTASTAVQSNAFATAGSFGLEVTGVNNNWFGVQFATPLDVSARRALTYDVRVGAQGGMRAVRLFVGTQRCQSDFSQLAANQTYNIEVDLTNLSCDAPNMDLSRVTAMYLRFGQGTYQLDNIQLK